jgi:hypothetical protein
MQTYGVRVYRPDEEAAGQAELRGVVDEVASGASATFHDGDELLRILARHPDRKTRGDRGRDEQ